MTHRLLTAKHWQLFLLVFAIPFVAMMVTMIIQISQVVRITELDQKPDPADFMLGSILAGVVGFAATFIHFSWIWSVATGLQRFMHSGMRKLRMQRFKLFFFIPLVYIVIIGISVPVLFAGALAPNSKPDMSVFVPMILLFVFCHCFAIFCIIYTLYFTVKTIRSVEMQKEAHFSDYIGEFFLLYFFPVGLWFLQPRINAIVNGQLPQLPSAPQDTIDQLGDF